MGQSKEIHFVVNNLVKIMNDKELSKKKFAEKIGFPEAKWSKIANGKQELSVIELSEIASKLQISEVDIYTYKNKHAEQKEKKTTKILVELEVTDIEFNELGLRNKIKKILER